MGIKERIDGITGITDEYRKAILPPPKSVKIELSGKCNLRCRHCITSTLSGRSTMNREFYESLIDELASLGLKEAGMFYLGESMLVYWLPQAIEYAKRAGIEYIFLTTNGTAGDLNAIEDCMKAGLDSLKFSVNYYDREKFYAITQSPSKQFLDLIAMIHGTKRIRDREKYQTKIYASYIQYNAEEGEKMREFMEREIAQFVDAYYALPLYGHEHIRGGADVNKWNVRGGNIGRLENPRPPVPCWSIFQEAHVTHDRRLAICCYYNEQNMGILNGRNFMECWNSTEFQKLRQAHLDNNVNGTVCEKCLEVEHAAKS